MDFPGRNCYFTFLFFCVNNVMQQTVYIYCIEDDAKLTSSFFTDLGNLIATRKANIKVVIRYRSYYFFKSYDIILDGLAPVKMQPIANIEHKRGFVLKDILDFLNKYQSKRSNEENVLLLQSHGYDGFIQVYDRCDTEKERCYSDKLDVVTFAAHLPFTFDAIVIDSCCMSTMKTLVGLKDMTRYVVACQYTCPYLGILSDRFLPCLALNKSLPNRLRLVSQAFIDRNLNRKKRWREVSDATDSTVIDMAKFSTFLEAFNRVDPHLKRVAAHRVVVYKDYATYDLYGLLKSLRQNDLAKLLQGCIVGHVKTDKRMKNKGISFGF